MKARETDDSCSASEECSWKSKFMPVLDLSDGMTYLTFTACLLDLYTFNHTLSSLSLSLSVSLSLSLFTVAFHLKYQTDLNKKRPHSLDWTYIQSLTKAWFISESTCRPSCHLNTWAIYRRWQSSHLFSAQDLFIMFFFFFNKSFHGWVDIFSSHNPHPLDYLEKVQSNQLAQLKVETLEG